MFQDILKTVEASIQKQMEEKFGLSAEQTAKSASAVREAVQKFLSQDILNNPQLAQGLLGNIQNLEQSETFVQLKTTIANALEQKAGLSPDMAAKVRDLSLTEFFSAIQQELTNENGQLDIQKVLSKVKITDLESSAKDLLGSLGGFFKK